MFVSDRRWPQLGWPARGPWLKSTAAILAAAMFDRTTASTSLVGAAAVVWCRPNKYAALVFSVLKLGWATVI